MGSWGVDLWDQRDILEKQSHSSIEFFDKIANFIKERIRIEQEYAKSLRRLVKQYQFKKKEEEDLPYTYQHSFKSFLQENDDFAGQREVISEEMYNNILKEMQKLSLESKAERKKTLNKLTDCKIQLDHHHKNLLAAKKKYDQASEEASSALKGYETASQSLDMTKAQILKYQKVSQEKGYLADKAREDYKASLDTFNGKQTLYYEGDIVKIINTELQDPEEKRIESLSMFTKLYSTIQQKVAPIISKCFEGMIDASNICDPKKDSLTLIDRYKTGEEHPGDIEYEEWGKPNNSTMLSVQKSKQNKSSIWGKKKEVITNENIANDYADLPIAQRKKKFNKAISSLEEQLAQLEKSRAGMVKIKETSEKFGGDINSILSQLDANAKETERISSLVHQYQCYLAAALEGETARKNSRPTSSVDSTATDLPPAPVENVAAPAVASEADESAAPPPPPPPPPPPEFPVDDFDDELRCSVLYDFSGTNDGEMTVYSGEELVVIDEDDGSGWTRVIRGEDEGYIPTSYIQRI